MLSVPLNKEVKLFTKPTMPIGWHWFTCSSSLQSELWISHANPPTELSRFNNNIFRHNNVIQ